MTTTTANSRLTTMEVAKSEMRLLPMRRTLDEGISRRRRSEVLRTLFDPDRSHATKSHALPPDRLGLRETLMARRRENVLGFARDRSAVLRIEDAGSAVVRDAEVAKARCADDVKRTSPVHLNAAPQQDSAAIGSFAWTYDRECESHLLHRIRRLTDLGWLENDRDPHNGRLST